jgi:predicted ATPase/DNA-binding winged helix-turn-helix (wHTH) protein
LPLKVGRALEQRPRAVYASDGWEIDLARHELRWRGALVPLGSRTLEIIEVLVQSSGELVNKYYLMGRVWPGAIVEENTLQFHISVARKAFGADRGLLKTVSGRGYRLLGNWTIQQANDEAELVDLGSARGPGHLFQTNVPVAASALIGRAAAKQQLLDVLSAYRVVTLTGPGGIGKTVLALEVARDQLRNFQGDVWFVELDTLRDPGLVPSAVAGVLGLKLGGGDISPETVARAIGAKQLLLVLDNCEHVIDSAAQMVETIVRMCPHAPVLATSREALRIEGEYAYRVPPLDVPIERLDDPGQVVEHSAVQLFVARTTALNSEFSPLRNDWPAIATICRHLDGIPLAIEFAAARAATLGPQQVASLLDDRFGLLTAGRRTAQRRQQTLRATLDWSYELLSGREQRLLRRLAIFPAGFTLEGATTVMTAIGAVSSTVAEGISNLVAKSLVTLEGSASDRWRMLETVRAYAFEKLAESGEAEQAARLHAEFFRDLFRPAMDSLPMQFTPEELARNARELDNVRAAIDWALSPAGDLSIGLELTAASAPLWFQLSLMAEYCGRAKRALQRLQAVSEPNDLVEMRLQAGLGYALWYSGIRPETMESMERAFARALALAERVGDTHVQLQALWGAWAVRRGRGEHRASLAVATKYEAIANEAGDQGSILLGDRMLGLTHHDLGNQKLARQHAETVLGQARHSARGFNTDFQVDAQVAMATLLTRIQWLEGFPSQAMATAHAAIEAALRTDHWFSICYALFMGGCPLSLWVGDLAEAQRRIDMLLDRAGGNPGLGGWARIYAAILRLRQGSERDALIASYIEPRLQISSMPTLDALVSGATIPLPAPDDEPDNAPGSLPEVLRVNAELLLWRGAPGADATAEAKLLRSLELAREQSALSWELRTALSLARLRVRQGRQAGARHVLKPVYDRFTEGFETIDLRSARSLLETLQD